MTLKEGLLLGHGWQEPEHLREILEQRVRPRSPPPSSKHQMREYLLEEWCSSCQLKCVRVRVCLCCVSQVHRDEDEDDGVVNYEDFGDPSASVRL